MTNQLASIIGVSIVIAVLIVWYYVYKNRDKYHYKERAAELNITIERHNKYFPDEQRPLLPPTYKEYKKRESSKGNIDQNPIITCDDIIEWGKEMDKKQIL